MYSEQKLRFEIIKTGKIIYRLGFAPGTSGNISARLGRRKILITASGAGKGFLTAEDISVVDMRGRLISGKPPSCETMMHLRIYGRRPEINAVVHAHPPVAAACSKSVVSAALARYFKPGSGKLAREVARLCKNSDSILLAKHGAVTFAETLQKAVRKMENLELISAA